MKKIKDTTQKCMGGRRHSTTALTANCQFGVFKAPTALSLSLALWFKICMTRHLFPIKRKRQRGRDGGGKKTKRGRTQTKIEDENIKERDRQRRTKKRDKEVSVERQKAFFSVNWRAR